jgi:hypothetical protein
MCAAVSLRPQFEHFSSGHSSPEFFPTWTLVPQKPVCCLDLHILYMLDFDDMARLRCSQSTSSKRSCGHFLVSASRRRAVSLLAWNRTGCDTSLVILFPHITIATSSHGSNCVGVLIYPVVMARWTAPFAVVSHTQLSC